MKIKSFLEHQSTEYREVIYGDMYEFVTTHKKEVFTEPEYAELPKFLK